MANIIFTNKCNIQCPFCFATENNTEVSDKAQEEFNALKAWEISNFISGNMFRFCGGEPTLHPEIIEIMNAIFKQGKDVFFMTNGIWPLNFKHYLSRLDTNSLLRTFFLFNVLEPKFYKNGEFDQILESIKIVIPQNTTLGLTIYKKDFPYRYLVDLALKFGIKKLRWSIAAPNITNQIDTPEDKFYSISERLHEFYETCFAENIELGGDCNYIQPCYFKDEQLLDIMMKSGKRFQFSCAGGSPVDIDTNGKAWRCYGLYAVLNTELNKFKKEEELEKYFTRRVKLLDNMYAYEECKECQYWQKGCNGGCYVYRIKKAFAQKPNMKLFPIDCDDEVMNCKPYLNKNVTLRKQGDDNQIYLNGKVINNPDENTFAFLQEINGKMSVSGLINKWKDNFSNLETASNTIVEKCRELFDKDFIKINYDYDVEAEKRPLK